MVQYHKHRCTALRQVNAEKAVLDRQIGYAQLVIPTARILGTCRRDTPLVRVRVRGGHEGLRKQAETCTVEMNVCWCPRSRNSRAFGSRRCAFAGIMNGEKGRCWCCALFVQRDIEAYSPVHGLDLVIRSTGFAGAVAREATRFGPARPTHCKVGA